MDWERLRIRYSQLDWQQRMELAPMQRELGLLRRAWEQNSEVARPLLAFRARAMSDRVLALAGLGQG